MPDAATNPLKDDLTTSEEGKPEQPTLDIISSHIQSPRGNQRTHPNTSLISIPHDKPPATVVQKSNPSTTPTDVTLLQLLPQMLWSRTHIPHQPKESTMDKNPPTSPAQGVNPAAATTYAKCVAPSLPILLSCGSMLASTDPSSIHLKFPSDNPSNHSHQDHPKSPIQLLSQITWRRT